MSTLQESALRDYGLGEFANTTTTDERGSANAPTVRSIPPALEFVVMEMNYQFPLLVASRG